VKLKTAKQGSLEKKHYPQWYYWAKKESLDADQPDKREGKTGELSLARGRGREESFLDTEGKRKVKKGKTAAVFQKELKILPLYTKGGGGEEVREKGRGEVCASETTAGRKGGLFTTALLKRKRRKEKRKD